MLQSEFEALIRLHQSEVYRYVRYLGANRTEAEDLVQDTFLAVYRNPPPEDAKAAAWLRGIARNLLLRHCRRVRTRAEVVTPQALEQAEAVWAQDFLRAGDGFDYVEALRRCLETLPDGQRRALDMQYAQRRSRSEIAGLLRMTEDGVKSLMRRIRARLADCVKRRLSAETA